MRVLKRWRSKPHSTLGVDVDATSIKMLELSCCKANYCVEAYAMVSLPPDVIESGVIRYPALLVEALKSLYAKGRFRSNRAVFAIPSIYTLRNKITLNTGLSIDTVEELICHESSKLTSCPKEDLCIDFESLGPSISPGMEDFFYIVTEAKHVASRMAVAKRTRLMTEAIELDVNALLRSLKILASEYAALPIGIVYVSLDAYYFLVVHQHCLIFSYEHSRDAKLSLDAFVQQAFSQFELSDGVSSITGILFLNMIDGEEAAKSFIRQLGLPSLALTIHNKLTLSNHCEVEAFEKDWEGYLIALGLALRSSA